MQRVLLSFILTLFFVGTAQATLVGKVEPNNSQAGAQSLDAFFDLSFSPLIGDAEVNTSTTLPHASVVAVGDGTFDFYSFTVPFAGAKGIFDIDTEPFFALGPLLDPHLNVYNPLGQLIAGQDDEDLTFGQGGSFTNHDPGFVFNFPTAGRHVARVAATVFRPDTSTAPVPQGRGYVLHVSVEGHHATPEPSTMLLLGSGLAGLAVWRYKKSLNP